MFPRLSVSLALLVASAPAFAAADLVTTITPPTGTHVYETGRYTVTVANTGNQNASAVSLVIQLPETNTSPTVHVLGTLGAKSASCATSGTTLVCTLGAIAKRRSTSVYFDIALPESVDPLVIDADATTSSAENSLANNGATHTAAPLNYAVSFAAPAAVLNRHCTGTNLTSFFECELYPSSISSHETTLEADGSITFVGAGPEYTGEWTSLGADHLAFTYYELGVPVAEFEGYGTSASCWEGLTTFPGSTYVSLYEVCLQ